MLKKVKKDYVYNTKFEIYSITKFLNYFLIFKKYQVIE